MFLETFVFIFRASRLFQPVFASLSGSKYRDASINRIFISDSDIYGEPKNKLCIAMLTDKNFYLRICDPAFEWSIQKIINTTKMTTVIAN